MDSGTVLLMVSLALLLGVMFGKLAKLCHMPSVTGYLLAGILFGPSMLGGVYFKGVSTGLSDEFLQKAKILYTTAFAFICFSLGEEIELKKLKETGKAAILISFVQTLATAAVVGGSLTVLALATGDKFISVPVALTLGALAAISAPTAKYMITRQYHAEGEITEMMAPVVALDDVFGIIIFSIVLSLSPALGNGTSVSVYSLLLSPLLEIVLSMGLGIVLGIILGYVTTIYRVAGSRLVLCIGFVLLAVAISEIMSNAGIFLNKSKHEGHLQLSPLLICITMGAAFSLINHEHGIRKKLDAWTFPMFVVFFVIAGAMLDIKAFADWAIIGIGAVYIASRFLGKYFGTRFGAKLTHRSLNMQKYLGITLLPQADVAMGLATIAVASLAGFAGGEKILGVVFAAGVLFEIIGHIWIRTALKNAGELHGDIEGEVDEPEPLGHA